MAPFNSVRSSTDTGPWIELTFEPLLEFIEGAGALHNNFLDKYSRRNSVLYCDRFGRGVRNSIGGFMGCFCVVRKLLAGNFVVEHQPDWRNMGRRVGGN